MMILGVVVLAVVVGLLLGFIFGAVAIYELSWWQRNGREGE